MFHQKLTRILLMTPVQIYKIKALFLGTVFLGASVAHAEPGPRVYIPTGDSAEVLIIDAGTNGVIGKIPGLPAAHGLAVTPDGSRLIAGSFDEREPSAAVPEKPAGVSAADHATHHAPKPSDAVEPMVSTLTVVDTATRSVVRRIDVPGTVHHVAVSPDGRVAAVTHPYADAITAIDLEALAVITTVPTGAMPNYAAFSRDGEKLYVSNSGEDTIAVLGRSTWSVTARIPVGQSPEHLALSPNVGRLFVSNVAGGSVSVIDLSAERAVETLPVGADLHGIDVSDDGETLFIANRGGDRLVAVDLQDGSRRGMALTPAPYHLSVIDGAGVLYVSSAVDSVVWVIDAATLESLAEIAIPGIGHQFAQAPGAE
jgi:YVTN family beta-propeller protein